MTAAHTSRAAPGTAAVPGPAGRRRARRLRLRLLVAGSLALGVAAAGVSAGSPLGARASAATTAPSPSPGGIGDGSIGVRLLDVPADEVKDPRAHLYILDRLDPGSVTRRHIEVDNTTATARSVSLYAAGATITDGSFLGAAGHTRDEISTWTSVDPGTAVIPAGGHLTVTVTIALPRDAAPGERYGVVWAQTSSAGPAGGFGETNRVGIRLYVSVGPGAAPAADFAITALTADRSAAGQPVVVATVRNTGGRALDMSGTLSLGGGPGGLSAGPFPARLGTTLAIADTEPVSVALDRQLPDGPWHARITLRSGLVVRSARATITFPDSGTGFTVAATPIGRNWLPALLIALGVVLLAVFALLFVLRRRWRRSGGRHRPHLG